MVLEFSASQVGWGGVSGVRDSPRLTSHAAGIRLHALLGTLL